ncbi:hypothetical protein BV898_17945 [Hypsibius exemplaris]|uniref:Uncharacterized protein n=1 Tax=Hypsibius exemplaris TaxID=2072580 RepID=A0A9X6NHV9_HYPEX|nr:hypothetical protein BV898_17945 [Hypsibius exemplaris]
MGLSFLRLNLHGLYITALITVIITISPSEAACCQDNNNHCGATLSSLCESSNLLPNSLYICEEGGDPSLIRICPDGCQAHVGGNDICKRVPVDNKTASQLLSDTELKHGQSLFSPDKKTKLLMQMNGDLVVVPFKKNLGDLLCRRAEEFLTGNVSVVDWNQLTSTAARIGQIVRKR